MSEATWAAAHHERLHFPSVVFFLGSIDPVTDGIFTRPTIGTADQISSKPTFGRRYPKTTAPTTLRPPHPQP
jgi:hypothetical protein